MTAAPQPPAAAPANPAAELPADLRADGATTRQPGKGRFMELEAFRALAALAVVVYHAYQYSGLQRSVDEGTPSSTVLNSLDGAVAFFLALSGFLLFLPIATAAIGQLGLLSSRGFLARRAVRIIPLYLIAVSVVWAVRTPTLPGPWQELVTHLTFTHIYFQEYIFTTIGPAWSLAVEIVFYVLLALLAPLAYRLCGRLGGRGARVGLLVGLVALLVGASLAFKLWAFGVAEIPFDNFPVYFSPIARLDNFALGMGLAVAAAATRGRWSAGPSLQLGVRLAGVAIIVAATLVRVDGGVGELLFHTIVSVGATLLFASSILAERGTRWERALSWRPFAALGLWSYSIYLWHEPVMQSLGRRGWLVSPTPEAFLSNAVVMVVLACVIGFLSYWIIEYPATNLRFLLKDRPPRP